MGDVLEFKLPDNEPEFEHVDSSTIVERLKMTPELKKEFEDAGYTVED